MSNQHHGSVLHQAFQGQVHVALRAWVQARGGLVQNQDVRRHQRNASESNELALASREQRTAFTNGRSQALRFGREARVRANTLKRELDVCIGRIGSRGADVVRHAALE